MYVYLSKKINIPDSGGLQCVAWSQTQNWITVGGQDGLLRVLKLESAAQKSTENDPHSMDAAAVGIAAPSNLTMNQFLDGHKSDVICAAWNSRHTKLTTSDTAGLIIVWMLYRGNWYEEMINNRECSVVTDMSWSPDGGKIAIVYEDGAVIVGSVEGSRIWGDEMKDVNLKKVCWSPDGKLILFGTGTGEVIAHDGNGIYCMKLSVRCVSLADGKFQLAAIKWYDGSRGRFLPDCAMLVIAYRNGRLQLMTSEADESPILVDTQMTITGVNWNHNGTMLAVAGQITVKDEGRDARDSNCVQFYNPNGEHLHTLRVPGRSIRGVDFDTSGLRVVMPCDAYLYFANIRGSHRWAYAHNTVVYSYSTPERAEHTVIFWDHKNNDRYVKQVRMLTDICAHNEYTVLCAKSSEEHEQYVLVLCNTIGTPLEHKYLDMEVTYLAMTDYQVFVASQGCIYIWDFKERRRIGKHDAVPGATTAYQPAASATLSVKERLLHIDEVPSGVGKEGTADFRKAKKHAMDRIVAITASNEKLVVARISGTIHVYGLPKVSLDAKHQLGFRANIMRINSDSSRMGIIDITGVFSIFDFDRLNDEGQAGVLHAMHRKDCWDLRWASDNPAQFAVMEKTRMYVFRDMDPEEPITSSGYICSFRDLEITICLLDQIMTSKEFPGKSCIVETEIKSLRDSRALLTKVSVEEASQFIKDNPHPRLWRLLADTALEKLDLDLAERAFVNSQDFGGIQFVKKLRKLRTPEKQKPEVLSYFKNFEAAEKDYLSQQRGDLSVELRAKLGDWFRVVHLLKMASAGGDDVMTRKAYNEIGDYYTDRQKWKPAITYYQQANNNTMLAQCYLRLEDYESLQTLARSIHDGDPLNQELGERFTAVGMCDDAIASYLKVNNAKAAVDTCVQLNKWYRAVELAKKHSLPGIEQLLSRYATHLLEHDNIIDAVQLYREANMFSEAASLLYELGGKAVSDQKDYLRAKKLYIMAGMMMEDYRITRNAAAQEHREGSTKMYLDEEYQSPETARMLDSTWRGAVAIHFFLTAQHNIYEGDIAAALRMALIASEYDDVLPEKDLFLLVALSAAMAQCDRHTSRAFTHLDDLVNVESELKEKLQDLAVDIFVEKSNRRGGAAAAARQNKMEFEEVHCEECGEPTEDWVTQCPACQHRHPYSVTDGRRLDPRVVYATCDLCHHSYDKVVQGVKRTSRSDQLACPVCHKVCDN
eukprot:scpid22207/ scgid3975/ WD repeat-containing protein 35; Naofen